MSELFTVRLANRSGNTVELEVLQTHPDAGDWEVFLSNFLLQAVALPAFGGDDWPPSATAPLGKEIGKFYDLMDAGLDVVQKYFVVKTKILRDVYNDKNGPARLAEAGLSKELTTENVLKICGRMQVILEAKDPRWLEHFNDATEWDIA
jgi:hypothetical protein